MDNLTHTLFAATLARTPLRRAGRGTTTALILASNAPDIDIVATVGGALKYLEWHRGPSHGPLGIAGLGLLTAGLVWAGRRVFDRQRAADHAPFRYLAITSVVGVLLHVLMDLPTAYGTRLFSPFDWHWYAIDLMPIIDVYLLVVLAAGLVFVARSDTARSRIAAIVLALMAANYGLRGVAHERALNLAPQVFGSRVPERCDSSAYSHPIVKRWPRPVSPSPASEAPRSCLVEVAALPTFAAPFDWRLVAQLSDGYEISDVNVLASRMRVSAPNSDTAARVTMRVPNQWTPGVFAAAGTEVGQRFLGFARFPAARAFVDGDGVTTVRWNEMRFTRGEVDAGQRGRREEFFTATVRIGRDGRIIEQRLGR
jgi:inner membrane protein